MGHGSGRGPWDGKTTDGMRGHRSDRRHSFLHLLNIIPLNEPDTHTRDWVGVRERPVPLYCLPVLSDKFIQSRFSQGIRMQGSSTMLQAEVVPRRDPVTGLSSSGKSREEMEEKP